MLKYIFRFIDSFFILFLIFGCKEKFSDTQKTSILGFLSQKEVNEFHKKGFIIVKNLLSVDEIKILKVVMEELKTIASDLTKKNNFNSGEFKIIHEGTQFVLKKSNDNQLQIQRIVWVASIKPELLEIGQKKEITSIVSQLLDRKEADHLINQIHPKYPNDQVDFGWHQDIENRINFDPNWKDVNNKGSFVQVLTAIDPMTRENGPLSYIPFDSKTHKTNLRLKKGENSQMIRNKEGIPILLEPGDTLFMNPYLIHGSQANKSNKSRLLFINGFSAKGANHKDYPGEGSARVIELIKSN